jgi:hypothetical protein
MDPANTIISDKLLLSDIDLQVTSPSSTVSYGNNRPGDEVNNAEQVLISTPSLGTYTVTLRSKVFTEVTSQPLSLIITSGGYVHGKVISSSTTTFSTNELSCGTGNQMVTLQLLDHGGNGWGSGNSFLIQNEAETVTYYTFTMNGDVGKDSLQEAAFCLPEGVRYVAKLNQKGSNTKEMGVTIPQCDVYLSAQLTTRTLDLTTASQCNPCSTSSSYLLQTTLYGPTKGIPYGWKDEAKYGLYQQLNASAEVITTLGTLTTGVMNEREFCLPQGVYYLEFDNVPANDDVYVAGTEGVSSYRIELVNCGSDTTPSDDKFDDDLFPYPRISPGKGFKITINPSSSSNKCSYVLVSDTRDPLYPQDDDNAAAFGSNHMKTMEMMIALGLGVMSVLFLLR